MGGAEEEVCPDVVGKEATQSAPTATPMKTPLKSTTKSTGASHHKSAALAPTLKCAHPDLQEHVPSYSAKCL